MRRIKKLLLQYSLLFSVSAFQPVSAQTQNFYFTNYGVKDGMSHGIVDDLFRDSEGFLWIATYNGLDRFDGTGFKVFHADYHNQEAIGDDYIQHICEDHDGNIWCGCDKGVSCFNRSTGGFNNYRLTNPNGLIVSANHVYDILCDRHGTIWCSSDAGIFEYDKQRNIFKGYYHAGNDINSISSDEVYKNSFVEDPKEDGIWISGPQGINFLDIKTKQFYNYRNNPNHLPVFTSDPVYPLSFDQNKNLWFSIRNKPVLCCYDPVLKTVSKTTIKTDEPGKELPYNIATLFFDSKNNCWFSTWYTRIFFRQQGTEIFKHILHDEANTSSINSNFFWDVIEDRDGTLWFGGLNGISKFQASSQYYSLLKPNESLPATQKFKVINAFFQSDDTLLWMGTDSGLYSYNFLSAHCKKFNDPTGNTNYINYIIKVGRELWLTGINDIKVFDPVSKKFVQKKPLPDELKSHPKSFENIHACRNGDIWICTRDTRELYHFEKSSGQWMHYRHDNNDPHSVSSLITSAIYEEENGTMWFGTLEDGIMRFDESKKQFDFFRTAYVNTTKIRIANMLAICGGKNGELYLLLARFGVIRFRYADSTAELYRQSDGLATESNFDMAKDSQQNIWLAGYQDVTAFNTEKKLFARYHVNYANVDYGYGNVIIILKNGDVGISILDAIALYKPGMMIEEKTLPPVLISDFSVFEKTIPFTQKKPDVNLSYKQNFFSVSFSAFSASGDDLQYAYKLDGFDKDWVYCGKRQIASYTNVPGGDYTFLVKSSATKGEWSVPATIHIFVSPPFWQTAWFRLLIICAAVFLIVVIFKIRERNYRSKQEQKLQVLKVRDRIAQDLHDDVGSTLTSINIWSEIANRSSGTNNEQSGELVKRIHDSSQQMLDRMSDIIWSVNSANDLAEQLLVRMRQHASDILEPKNIAYEFRLDEGVETMKLPMEQRREIFLIFKEAVNNLCKYAQCSNVVFEMKLQSGNLIFSIKDDGAGFDMHNNFAGNGLKNMKQRAKNIGGGLDIHSEKGRGTEIRLQTKIT